MSFHVLRLRDRFFVRDKVILRSVLRRHQLGVRLLPFDLRVEVKLAGLIDGR